MFSLDEVHWFVEGDTELGSPMVFVINRPVDLLALWKGACCRVNVRTTPREGNDQSQERQRVS